jgi:hypothetical protein
MCIQPKTLKMFNDKLKLDWSNSDYSYASSMMDTDQNCNIFVFGDTAIGYYQVIKKFDPTGSHL